MRVTGFKFITGITNPSPNMKPIQVGACLNSRSGFTYKEMEDLPNCYVSDFDASTTIMTVKFSRPYLLNELPELFQTAKKGLNMGVNAANMILIYEN